MNENRHMIQLAKLIVGLTIFTSVAVYPPVLLVGIVGWAGWTLWRNYTV